MNKSLHFHFVAILLAAPINVRSKILKKRSSRTYGNSVV